MNKRIRGAEANSATLSYKSEKNQPRGLKDHQKGPIDSANRERKNREKERKRGGLGGSQEPAVTLNCYTLPTVVDVTALSSSFSQGM